MGFVGFRGIYPFTKKMTIGADIKQLKPVGFYNVPLKLNNITESEPVVNIGDTVKQGTLIAKPTGKVGINIFSPVAGKVLNIVKKMTPNGEYVKHMLIMRNENEEEDDFVDLPALESMSDINLVARLRDAGIVDNVLNLPSYIKYSYMGARSYKHLYVLCDTTDPNNSVNQTITEFRMEEVINGAKYFSNITGVANITFVFTDSNFKLANKLKKHIMESKKSYDFKIKFIPNKYPFDNPYILTKVLLRKNINEDNSFLKEGIAIETAESCYNLCRAVEFNKPVVSKVVTVDGTNVSRPGNYFVSSGYSYQNLLDEVGINDLEIKSQLIDGNVLSGIAQYSTDLCLSLSTETILYMQHDILTNLEENPCISCGKCVSVCPMFLNPTRLDETYINEDYAKLDKLNVHSCIECGCCSYICPSKRYLTQRIAAGKYYDRQRRNRG